MTTTKELSSAAVSIRDGIENIIRPYFKVHPTEIFDLAERSGFTPQEAEFIINNSSAKLADLISLYEAYKKMVAEKTKTIIQKHL